MEIHAFDQNDINLLGELQPADWGDIIFPFNFYSKAEFCYPIKVLMDDRMVGIGCSIIHNNVAWLAHIIVHPHFRSRGIGRRVTEKLIDLSKSKGCETINLIATELGSPVYEKIGFITDTEYIFFKDLQLSADWTISENIKRIDE